MHTDDTTLIADLRTLIDGNILSGPETLAAEDFIDRIDEPDPKWRSGSDPDAQPPSEERREIDEEIRQRNYTHLINLQTTNS